MSDMLVAAGNYTENGMRTEGDFVIENKTRENDVRYLCSVLNKAALASREGILPVLGYRQPPHNEADGSKIFQLIIELPGNTRRESLAFRIFNEPRPTVVVRLQICLCIARAVTSVHGMNRVHKRIRTRAILMLSDQSSHIADSRVYLQDWTCIREVSGATTQLGEASWQKAIYQHPERQGIYAEASYQTKHDLYSLGVAILEVLLWSLFVVPEPASTSGEQDRICDTFERIGLQLGEANSGLPERYRGDTMKLTSRPRATKATWCEIARTQLHEPDLQDLVLGCLDESFQEVTEVVESIEKAVAARV